MILGDITYRNIWQMFTMALAMRRGAFHELVHLVSEVVVETWARRRGGLVGAHEVAGRAGGLVGHAAAGAPDRARHEVMRGLGGFVADAAARTPVRGAGGQCGGGVRGHGL